MKRDFHWDEIVSASEGEQYSVWWLITKRDKMPTNNGLLRSEEKWVKNYKCFENSELQTTVPHWRRINTWVFRCSQEDNNQNKRCHADVLEWRQASKKASDGPWNVSNATAPTLHSQDSWCPLAACIAGVFSWVSCLQFIDNQLDYGSFLF